jgi:hypothetical protein
MKREMIETPATDKRCSWRRFRWCPTRTTHAVPGERHNIRAHLYGCAMLPSEVRLRAQAVREAAQRLVKQSQELVDNADIPIREAETALFVSRQALRAAMRRRTQS